MSADLIALLILGAIGFLLLYGIITIAVNRRSIGNFSSMTVYHDFQTKDKQEGIEIVMEKKSGNKFISQESGVGEDGIGRKSSNKAMPQT